MSELCFSLALCKDGAVGPDSLSYPSLVIFIPQQWSFYLASSIGFTRLNFPDLWHQSIVIPIPKPAKDHSSSGNFRPISFTSCLCKLLERMVAERLIWVLEGIQGLFPIQFGFHRFRSTADPFVRLEHDISAAFENGKFVLAVFFDLQKAYDTTWKRGVLRKLLSLGFCEHVPIFIRNLLTIHSFCVRVRDTLSPSFDQIESVP